MNVILYKNGDNNISYFIRDCIKKGNNFIGSNMELFGIKRVEVIWTDDEVNPILNQNGDIIGYDKTVSEIIPIVDSDEIIKTTDSDYKIALRIRKDIANLSYNQIDNYVETNITDLISAKDYLKRLSKVVLAIIKMHDK